MEERVVKVIRGQLHKALNELLKDLTEDEILAGGTIEIEPVMEGEEVVALRVNWNS